MTNEEIDKLEAGPELDALIAEKVMGCTLVNHVNPKYGVTCGCAYGAHRQVQEHIDDLLADYSTDMTYAWKVVERIRLAYAVQIDERRAGWACELTPWWEDDAERELQRMFASEYEKYGIVIAETAPLAICRAAIRAVLSQKQVKGD